MIHGRHKINCGTHKSNSHTKINSRTTLNNFDTEKLIVHIKIIPEVHINIYEIPQK